MLAGQKDTKMKNRGFHLKVFVKIEDKDRYIKQQLTYNLKSTRLDTGIQKILCNMEDGMKAGDGSSGRPKENFVSFIFQHVRWNSGVRWRINHRHLHNKKKGNFLFACFIHKLT